MLMTMVTFRQKGFMKKSQTFCIYEKKKSLPPGNLSAMYMELALLSGHQSSEVHF